MSDGAGGMAGGPPYLAQAKLVETLPLPAAIEALERGFAALGEQPLPVHSPHRRADAARRAAPGERDAP